MEADFSTSAWSGSAADLHIAGPLVMACLGPQALLHLPQVYTRDLQGHPVVTGSPKQIMMLRQESGAKNMMSEVEAAIVRVDMHMLQLQCRHTRLIP